VAVSEVAHPHEIEVSDGEATTAIAVGRIAYFVHALRVRMVTTQGRGYALDHSLDELEVRLDPRSFFRLNGQLLTHRQSVHKAHALAKGRIEGRALAAVRRARGRSRRARTGVPAVVAAELSR
jgi:DNA-binding LytR/AlgR family response regulator